MATPGPRRTGWRDRLPPTPSPDAVCVRHRPCRGTRAACRRSRERRTAHPQVIRRNSPGGSARCPQTSTTPCTARRNRPRLPRRRRCPWSPRRTARAATRPVCVNVQSRRQASPAAMTTGRRPRDRPVLRWGLACRHAASELAGSGASYAMWRRCPGVLAAAQRCHPSPVPPTPNPITPCVSPPRRTDGKRMRRRRRDHRESRGAHRPEPPNPVRPVWPARPRSDARRPSRPAR